MVNSAKWAKRKRLAQEAQQRETFRPAHQMDPADLSDPGTEREEEDDQEIKSVSRRQNVEEPSPTPARAQATTDCEILNMVRTLNGAIAAVSQDTARIQRAYYQLRAENIARDKALMDLSEIVKEYGSPLVHMRPTRCYRQTCWTGRATYVPQTSGSLGRTTKPSSTASGWLDRALHDQLEWDRWCRHRISQGEDRTGMIHPRQFSHRHSEHQK